MNKHIMHPQDKYHLAKSLQGTRRAPLTPQERDEYIENLRKVALTTISSLTLLGQRAALNDIATKAFRAAHSNLPQEMPRTSS